MGSLRKDAATQTPCVPHMRATGTPVDRAGLPLHQVRGLIIPWVSSINRESIKRAGT